MTQNTNLRSLTSQSFGRLLRYLCIILVFLVLTILPQSVLAAQITGRSFTLSSSAGAATSVEYDFDADAVPTTGSTIQSVQALACTTASGSCTTPTGFDASSATLDTQPAGLGDASGWTDASTAGALRVEKPTNGTTPSGAVDIDWGGVTNPTAVNTTFFLRVTTYSDSYTTSVDTGTVAVSTAEQITVSASVDETLTFCVGTSGVTTSSCAGATGSAVNLGTLSSSSTSSSTSQFGVTTNAESGYSVTLNGTTLTSGSNTISALASQTAATTGTEQFGINLVANATPSVGADPDGAGDATPTANYGTADQFRFVTGDSIASDAEADAFRRFTVSYIANISGATEPGTYQAVLTFICTATF